MGTSGTPALRPWLAVALLAAAATAGSLLAGVAVAAQPSGQSSGTAALTCPRSLAPVSVAQATAARPGDIAAAVPAVTFIRLVSGTVTVTTNTGRPPSPTDEFYLLTPGHAQPAPADWRQGVLTACG